ncbi:MAG: M48 family metallopeptidase [Planctomycetota bacterium]
MPSVGVQRAALARLLGVVSVLLAPILGGCATNPATGERFFSTMSWEQEIQLGEEAAPSLTEQFGGEVEDAELRRFTDRVGRDLLRGIEDGVPELEWEFTLLDSDVINAFALPGGKVFMSRGLAARMTNEAQFAAVMGHEIGHVTGRHGNRRMSQQVGFNVIVAALGIGVTAADEDSAFRKYGKYGLPVLAVGGNLVLLSYGRGDELEADMLGMRYMVRAGYDPVGAVEVQELLLEAAAGASRPPEILSSHPSGQRRIRDLENLITSEYAYTQGNDDYRLFADRWRRGFLHRLPSNAEGPAASTNALAARTMSAERLLASPALWCAHCADGTH